MPDYKNPAGVTPQLCGFTRHTFLGKTHLAGLTLRSLVLAALLMSTSALAQNQNAIPTDLNEATVAQLQAKMASGNLTSEGLTQYYITRILALDQKGPGVNSVIELNPNALAIARQMDALRRHGRLWGRSRGRRAKPMKGSRSRFVKPRRSFS